MLSGILIFAGLAAALATVLVLTASLLPGEDDGVAGRIEALLPKIQCAQCGYPGCRPYAEAIAAGSTDINRCPPGGQSTVEQIAELLGRDAPPLDDSLGKATMTQVARVREADCIGCNLCARACPVDAIVGVQQTMHTVIGAYCTGCELCLPACPVDCIELVARHA